MLVPTTSIHVMYILPNVDKNDLDASRPLLRAPHDIEISIYQTKEPSTSQRSLYA